MKRKLLAVSLALLAGVQEHQAATTLFPGPDYVVPGVRLSIQPTSKFYFQAKRFSRRCSGEGNP
jgi:hypothetical protein